MFHLVLCEANAVVADSDGDMIVIAVGGYVEGDLPSFGGVFGCIGQQVEDDFV